MQFKHYKSAELENKHNTKSMSLNDEREYSIICALDW
jgi:hypothetical protein